MSRMKPWRALILILLLTVTCLGQSVDQLATNVVFLQEAPPGIRSGTGFFVSLDGMNLFLVTAEHVSLVLGSSFRVTTRGPNDTPIELTSEELTGTKNVSWVTQGKEDVAVTWLHPDERTYSKLQGRFIGSKNLPSDGDAPSRKRPLVVLGFPWGLGVHEHFSPISKESKAASGLISFPRFDTHELATFFLLDSPSIGGFSGAPVFAPPTPYASSTAGMVFPATGNPTICVGLVHGTISDDTGGKMAAITPSIYVLETIGNAVKSVSLKNQSLKRN
jgi:Trypsin-like peptidase domain